MFDVNPLAHTFHLNDLARHNGTASHGLPARQRKTGVSRAVVTAVVSCLVVFFVSGALVI